MMQNKVAAVQSTSFEKKLYIATANQGARNQGRNKKRHDAFYKQLKQKAAGVLHAKIDYFENENHRSVPLKAIYEGLKFIYQPK